jgi:23S rRNA pseudouridine1911/1915/1917 synthase
MREFHYTVTSEDVEEGLALKDIIRRRFSFSSRLRKRVKYAKSVYLNGEQTEGWITPLEGDEVKVVIPEERSHFEPQDIAINVIYEDEDLLIINKQPFFVVHPTRGQYKNTIANGIMKYINDSGQVFKIRFINRLDMDTSGILLVGKNSNAQDNFMKQLEHGNVRKTYRAVVCGIIEEESGVIDLPIGFEGPDSPKRCVREDGKASVTKYRVLERFFTGSGYTLAELDLITGRTHQIRVHMAHIGHPVVGDPLYGREQVYLIERQALHAYGLSFDHPVSHKRLDITAPIPGDMVKLIENLKNQKD